MYLGTVIIKNKKQKTSGKYVAFQHPTSKQTKLIDFNTFFEQANI